MNTETEDADFDSADPHPEQQHPDRWVLLLDVLAFQFKLLLDGLRDILLSPISITAAVIGVITGGNHPGKYFYRLLEFGHKTDRWINLFGAYSDKQEKQPVSDAYVSKIESLIISEYRKGGVVKDLKSRTDALFDRLNQEKH